MVGGLSHRAIPKDLDIISPRKRNRNHSLYQKTEGGKRNKVGRKGAVNQKMGKKAGVGLGEPCAIGGIKTNGKKPRERKSVYRGGVSG